MCQKTDLLIKISGNMATQDCILGMEFSGRNSEGHKVMGLLPAKVIFLSKYYYYELCMYRPQGSSFANQSYIRRF